MRRGWFVVALLLAGCSSPADLDAGGPPTDEPSHPRGASGIDASGMPSVTHSRPEGLNITVGGNGSVEIQGELAAGEGFWVTFPFNGSLDRASGSFQLEIEAGDGCGGTFLFLRPSLMTVEDEAHHFSFEPWFVLGTTGQSGGMGAASSAPSFVAMTSALVAESRLCFDLNLTVDAPSLRQPNVIGLQSTWSSIGPYTAHDGAFQIPIERTGWTHAHRVPTCDSPITALAPSELVTADLLFPNGLRLRAGPYLNGIFPGPTVDDAAFFGAFHDEAGMLEAEVVAPTPECLVIIDTDLDLNWVEPHAGYVDRWWRHEPLLPP